jgi:O-antigen/teichoic acid export membrane protein
MRVPLTLIARNAFWNYVGYGFETLVGALLLAFVVRRVGVAAYGLLLVSYSIVNLLGMLDLGVSNVLVPHYLARLRNDGPRGLLTLLSSATLAFAALGAAGLSLAAALATYLPWHLGLAREMIPDAAFVILAAGVNVQFALPLRAVESTLEAFQRFDTLNLVQVCLTPLRAMGTFGLLYAGYGIRGLAVLQVFLIAVRLIILLLVTPACCKGVRFSLGEWDWKSLAGLRNAGRWTMLDTFALQLSASAEPLMLSLFGSVGAVALYGAGGRMPTHGSIVLDRWLTVVYPALAAHNPQNDRTALEKLFVQTLRVVAGINLPVLVLGSMFAEDILKLWLGKPYIAAAPVMRWLLVAMAARALTKPAEFVLYVHGRVDRLAKTSAVESVAKIALGLALLIPYGAAGLAAANAVTKIAAASYLLRAACQSAGLRVAVVFRNFTPAVGWVSSR